MVARPAVSLQRLPTCSDGTIEHGKEDILHNSPLKGIGVGVLQGFLIDLLFSADFQPKQKYIYIYIYIYISKEILILYGF